MLRSGKVRPGLPGDRENLGRGSVLERGRDVPEAVSEETISPESRPEYTVVGIVEDGAALNRAVKEIQELGVGRDNLTVVLKRKDPDENRGLEVPVGFAVAFLVLGAFFAIAVPSIGVPTFLVFISLAAILLAGSFTRVGVQPILTDMQAPREESGAWNDQFEIGNILIFAVIDERQLVRPIREIIQANGVSEASYYVVDRRLRPRAVGQAVMHRAGPAEQGNRAAGAQDA